MSYPDFVIKGMALTKRNKMMNTKNQSPKAAQLLVDRAMSLGLDASIIDNSTAQHRRDHPLGSTSVSQKVVVIDDIKFSVGGAKQYLTAREIK